MKTTIIHLQPKRARQAGNSRTRSLRLFGIVAASLTLAATSVCAQWSAPVPLSRPAVNAESPSATINDDGQMVAVWARQQGTGFAVQASVNLTGTWTQAVNLAAGSEPDVAIDNSGVATAVWSSGTAIQSSRLLPSGSWSRPVAISTIGTLARSPQVVADAAGNLTALWVRYDSGGLPGVETANRPVGGNWSAPALLSPGAPDEVNLVINANGDAAAIWSSFVSNAAVVSAERPFGGTWSINTVAPPAYRQGGATIGIDASGNLTACWRTYTEIRVADKHAGATWGPPITVYANNAVSDLPVMAKTASGDDMVALITYVFNGGGYNYQIRTSVRPAGGSWGPVTVLTNKNEYDTQLHAGTTTGGSFVLTWANDNRTAFESSTCTAATSWAPLSVITTGEFGTNLAVAGNTALAIWLGGSFQAMVSTLAVSP
jgi:hypothetical protein